MSEQSRSGAGAPTLPAAGFFLLAALGLFWGLNWPAIKLSVTELPVWWFRMISVGLGGLGILTIGRLVTGRLFPHRADVGPLLFVSVFSVLGWHLCTGYGVSLMPAGRAAIIAYMMPVFASLLAVPVLGEPMTRTKVVGLVLGVSGLAVLMGPDIVVLQTAPLGALFMLGAAASWGVGTVLFKKFRWQTPISVLVGNQMMIGFVIIAPVAVMVEPVPDFANLRTETWAAMIYLIALPMIFCQWAYLKVVSLFPAAIAAIGTLAVPIVGVYSSALILGEAVGWREFAALALISAALVVVLIVPALRRNGMGVASALASRRRS